MTYDIFLQIVTRDHTDNLMPLSDGIKKIFGKTGIKECVNNLPFVNTSYDYYITDYRIHTTAECNSVSVKTLFDRIKSEVIKLSRSPKREILIIRGWYSEIALSYTIPVHLMPTATHQKVKSLVLVDLYYPMEGGIVCDCDKIDAVRHQFCKRLVPVDKKTLDKKIKDAPDGLIWYNANKHGVPAFMYIGNCCIGEIDLFGRLCEKVK